MVELTLPIVIAAALADSINPCVLGVLIFLMAYMKTAFKKTSKLLIGGAIYTIVVYISYFLLGLGILAVAGTLSVPFYWFAAIIAILAGLLEVKDYFFYGKGFSLAIFPSAAKRLEYYAKHFEKFSERHFLLLLGFTALLGVFVVLVELPCTGAPYFVIIGLIAKGQISQGIPLLLLYNLIFILPLIVIIAVIALGFSSNKLEKWRKKHRGLMRLFIGIFLIALGLYMIWSVI